MDLGWGGEERTWWCHVKVVMEHVPLEAWNEEGVKLILGDSCVFDRFDRRTSAKDTLQFLGCWVWMTDPDELPRSLEYTYFAARAGQAMDIAGLPMTTRLPASPPIGMVGEDAIIIHMAGYEDWTPRSPTAAGSRTSSEHGSSAPTVVPFAWTPGVLDGRPVPTRRVRPDGCRAPTMRWAPREDDDDGDDFREPPHRGDVPKSTRVRQLFPSCTSERSVRVRTRSPPTYHRAWNGDQDHAMLDRGRPSSRSPRRSVHGRDALQHASEEWERRRSRSPIARSRLACLDPLLDFHNRPDFDRAAQAATLSPEDDPMLHEYGFSMLRMDDCSGSRSNKLLSYSPNNDGNYSSGRQSSPEYRPVSGSWATTTSAQQVGKEIAFGPGIQLEAPTKKPEHLMLEISDLVTRMEIDEAAQASDPAPTSGDASDVDDSAAKRGQNLNAAANYETEAVPAALRKTQEEPEDEYAAFSSGLFKAVPPPILQKLDPPAPSNSRSKWRTAAPSRSSTRLAARPSPFPVAERAQQKLMRELSFVSGKSVAPDAAVTAYIDMYGEDLPDDAV